MRGFTLIELLVVLTVIALIATIATPMIQRAVPGVELKTTAESLRAELRLARSVKWMLRLHWSGIVWNYLPASFALSRSMITAIAWSHFFLY